MALRSYEWLLALYFIYTAILAQALRLPPGVATVTLLLNLTVLAAVALLAYVDGLRRRFFAIVRDWFPFPLALLAYREMGWFAQPHRSTALEEAWLRWDRWLLNDLGARRAIEVFGPVLPAILEISYTLVYTLGLCGVAALYVCGHRKRVPRFLFVFLFGVLIAYAQFPFWPSEPPRTLWPGQDFPSYETPFRRFNWWLLGGYGIHTSVFPSAHVSGAFSAAFGMIAVLPEKPWVGRCLLVMAVLIATATVYGRYHYLADALAGLACAVLAVFVRKAT